MSLQTLVIIHVNSLTTCAMRTYPVVRPDKVLLFIGDCSTSLGSVTLRKAALHINIDTRIMVAWALRAAGSFRYEWEAEKVEVMKKTTNSLRALPFCIFELPCQLQV